jgi:KipI family sensor histidine kinase inhibitor
LFEAPGEFSLPVQQRIWALADAAAGWQGIEETVPGVTNLLVIFVRPPRDPDAMGAALMEAWEHLPPKQLSGRVIEVPVIYGGELSEDLPAVCAYSGLSAEEVIHLHSAGEYTVCALGSSPGFGYLHGLDARLFMPRKTVPSLCMLKGTVTIGGMQAGISVSTGPNGWNAIGFCSQWMFDLERDPPTRLAAGDPTIMDHLGGLAKQRKVAVGAHPGMPDLVGFGRRAMQLSVSELETSLAYQIGALQGIATAAGYRVAHVSYHAAFGNMATGDKDIADVMARAIARIDRNLIVYSMPDTEVEFAALRAGLRSMTMFLADRAYHENGELVSRKVPNSVISATDAISARVLQFLNDGSVTSIEGKTIKVRARGSWCTATRQARCSLPAPSAASSRPAAARWRRPAKSWPERAASGPGQLAAGPRGPSQRPARTASSVNSARTARTAIVASESGAWSGTHSDTVSSMWGASMARTTERAGVATSLATDQGRIVAPAPAAIASRNVPNDSTSAVMSGARCRLANPISIARRTKLARLGSSNGRSARSFSATADPGLPGSGWSTGATRQNSSVARGWKAMPRIGPVPCMTAMSRRPFMSSSLKVTAKPSTTRTSTLG